MKVLVIECSKQPVVKEIDNTLAAMQQVVDGYIQMVFPWRNDVALICNEEGKLMGLPLNRPLFDDEGNLIDLIVGTFFLCYAPATEENFQSLPEEYIDQYTKMFELK